MLIALSLGPSSQLAVQLRYRIIHDLLMRPRPKLLRDGWHGLPSYDGQLCHGGFGTMRRWDTGTRSGHQSTILSETERTATVISTCHLLISTCITLVDVGVDALLETRPAISTQSCLPTPTNVQSGKIQRWELVDPSAPHAFHILPPAPSTAGVHLSRGLSWNIQGENETLFGSWIQRQDPLDDVDLAGVHAYYDITRERGRGIFAMVAPRGRRREVGRRGYSCAKGRLPPHGLGVL